MFNRRSAKVRSLEGVLARIDADTHQQRNQKILEAIAEETERAVASKKVARETLISEGIYTTKGKLRVEFGGERKKERVPA